MANRWNAWPANITRGDGQPYSSLSKRPSHFCYNNHHHWRYIKKGYLIALCVCVASRVRVPVRTRWWIPAPAGHNQLRQPRLLWLAGHPTDRLADRESWKTLSIDFWFNFHFIPFHSYRLYIDLAVYIWSLPKSISHQWVIITRLCCVGLDQLDLLLLVTVGWWY